jgi:YHS domain-containing protein/CheY-like chemotaxis protein
LYDDRRKEPESMKRVLIVDDDENFLKVLNFALTREGFDVYKCTSGEAAITLMEDRVFSLVISDYRLQGVSGLAVVREARKKIPPIPTILLTAYAGSLYGNNWGHLPERVLSKPVDFEKLVSIIDKLEDDTGKEVSMTVKDPVCGMEIDSEKAAGNLEHGGKTYYFCGQGCLDKFKAEPEKFLKSEEHHHQK